ncbi:thiamine phosphate synthase, partial [candidate division WOR-3 bacterium]|nr:thiamine phosphate synthase [candidate division WOR-3 bacterium]
NGSNTLFFINDRPDIAIMSKADGVHLGQIDLPLKECRQLSDKLFIGKSTHTLKQMKDALKEKPDYIGIGPIYKTESKKLPDNVLGLDKSMEMLKRSNVPAIGIGGIKDFNLKEVIERGFGNIGIISYITKSKEPEKQIEEIKNIFRSYYDTEN